MVAKLEGPQFSGGANIAIKCPSHTYDQTVSFYRDTLGLPLIDEEKDGCKEKGSCTTNNEEKLVMMRG